MTRVKSYSTRTVRARRAVLVGKRTQPHAGTRPEALSQKARCAAFHRCLSSAFPRDAAGSCAPHGCVLCHDTHERFALLWMNDGVSRSCIYAQASNVHAYSGCLSCNLHNHRAIKTPSSAMVEYNVKCLRATYAVGMW